MDKYFKYKDSRMYFHYSLSEKPNPSDFKTHIHQYCELYYFISGKGVFKIEGSEYRLRSGDILLMRPEEAHYINIDPNEPYERLTVHFDTRLFSSIDENLEILKPFFDRGVGKSNLFRESDFKSSSFKYLLRNLTTNTENKKLLIYSNLFSLLNEIYISFEHKNDYTTRETIPYQIISYINANLFENISLESISEKFFISKSHLCRIFKEATGSTVTQYIITKKILKANTLITQGETPTNASISCGFSDYSVFYRNYMKYYKHPPSSQ